MVVVKQVFLFIYHHFVPPKSVKFAVFTGAADAVAPVPKLPIAPVPLADPAAAARARALAADAATDESARVAGAAEGGGAGKFGIEGELKRLPIKYLRGLTPSYNFSGSITKK